MRKVFLGLCCILAGSAQNLRLSTLDLSTSFRLNNTWQQASSMSYLPAANKIVASPGTGVLVHKTSKQSDLLASNLMHEDLYVEFDFMLAKDAAFGLLFEGQYALNFKDSWQGGSSGFLDNISPRINASKAPGLWQHATVMYGKNGLFKKVTLNGAIIHENIKLPNKNKSAALTISSEPNAIALRNIKYALLSDVDIHWQKLSYETFEINKESKKPEGLPKTGSLKRLDARIANDANYFQTIYKGELSLPETDSYVFNLERNGVAVLKIDHEVIMPSSWKILPENTVFTKNLAGGIHHVELSYFKDFSWRPTTLALTIQKSNAKPILLHEPTSIPEPEPEPLISLSPTKETIMQRSYWQQGDKKHTHVVSVGSILNRHYAYNLDKASPFAIWTGPFLRTTDMWFERGEPQTADPMGPTVYTDFVPPVKGTMVLKGYQLDQNKNPRFNYVLADKSTFSDLIVPSTSGLTRTFSHSKPQQIILASGNIQAVEKGLWSVDQQYFIKTTAKAAIEGNILSVNSISSTTYEIIW